MTDCRDEQDSDHRFTDREVALLLQRAADRLASAARDLAAEKEEER